MALFAGRKLVQPQVGDEVEVVQGEFCGQTFTVINLTGNAFAQAQRVHVRGPDGVEYWYWPWNLRVTYCKAEDDAWFNRKQSTE